MAPGGVLVLDFEILHHAVLGQNLFEQLAQPGITKNPFAQFINEVVLDLLWSQPKCPIEGPVGFDHAKPASKHQERAANRIDSCLRELASILDLGVTNLEFLVD